MIRRQLYTPPVGRFLGLLGLAFSLAACARSYPPPTGPVPLGEAVERAAPVVPEAPRPAPAPVARASVGATMPLARNLAVDDELSFLVGQRPHVLSSWFERGLPYRPFIEEVLDEWELPRELYYLAMIESGFAPTARSHAGAVGMWQFMPRTGRAEGLRIDDWVDERRDPVRSTRAAAQHLTRLYEAFGDWPLAMAAYNAGAGRVSRSMERFGARDYWELIRRGDLARETRQYVPRIHAVASVSRDPGAFGLNRPGEAPWIFAVDSLTVQDSIGVTRLSEITGVRPDTIRALNPNLLREQTPPGRYTVWVPAGAGPEIEDRYAAAILDRPRLGTVAVAREPAPSPPARRPTAAPPGQRSAEAGPREAPAPSERQPPGTVHIVSEGEHLWTIARRYDVPIAALEAANGLNGRTVQEGDEIVIPASIAAVEEAEAASTAGPVQAHRVEAGDTLWSISRRYGVDLDELRAANGLREGDPIHAGQTLELPDTSAGG